VPKAAGATVLRGASGPASFEAMFRKLFGLGPAPVSDPVFGKLWFPPTHMKSATKCPASRLSRG